MPHWRLRLVDDHALFREGLAGLFAYQPYFSIVGQAEDAEGAVAQAEALRPDLVLMDVDLPGEDGASATRRIAARDGLRWASCLWVRRGRRPPVS